MNMENYFFNYLNKFKNVIDGISIAEVNEFHGRLKAAIDSEKQIFVFGNGGSAKSMSHFATDMVKGVADSMKKKVKVICLNDNTGLITAIGNDYSFDDVFYRQLKILSNPGDLVLTLSVSGDSPNLVKAYEWACENGIQSIAMVGAKKGRLPSLADYTIVIDSLHYGHVEDAHMLICHMLAFGFIENSQLV